MPNMPSNTHGAAAAHPLPVIRASGQEAHCSRSIRLNSVSIEPDHEIAEDFV